MRSTIPHPKWMTHLIELASSWLRRRRLHYTVDGITMVLCRLRLSLLLYTAHRDVVVVVVLLALRISGSPCEAVGAEMSSWSNQVARVAIIQLLFLKGPIYSVVCTSSLPQLYNNWKMAAVRGL